jgi:HEPN domain-containing protein
LDRSRDWLNQATYDLAAAKNLLNSGDHAWSCFLSQQTVEKSLKAIGEKFNIIIWGHDLVDILKELKKSIEIPHLIELHCKTLNLYYISTDIQMLLVAEFLLKNFQKSKHKKP